MTRHGDLYLYGLPFSEPERIVVGGHAVLRPLIRAAKMFPRFRLLTVSANRVRLYSGDISSLAPLDCEALPESLEDALGTELTEPALQFQSTSGHGRHAGYHGHGGAPRGREIDLERFHQRIARALESGLSDAGPPLILAGDRVHHVGLAKALRRDIGLQQGLVEGNVDNLSESELLDRAVTAVEKTREAPEAALRRIAAQSALVTGAEAVAEQIVMGRVRHLWVGQSEDRLGRLDPMEAAILPPRADEELADELAALTLERGGSVDVLEDPSEWSSDGGFIAALR
ncbi:MAG: hypothetical protein HKP27_16175 [Myxococcales bacterium]|nr:hypothetical protein [Myxococcales bacterium]